MKEAFLVKRYVIGMLVVCTVFLLAACGKNNAQLPVNSEPEEVLKKSIINTDGDEIGEVVVTEGTEGVTMKLEASGLEPGIHGIHIHETGKCVAPDFKSAGGHFNPTQKEHGFNNLKGFHKGDLPNVEVADDGRLSTEVTTAEVTLKPGQPNSILDNQGSALVIHETADDYKTDPSGNSGNRIACAELVK